MSGPASTASDPAEPASGATSGAPRPAGPPPTLEEVRAAFPGLEIESLLGQGGMGSVFRARQPKLDRTVALKVLPRALGADPAFAERFGREARALARLTHPGIVTVHDFGCAEGLHFLVMEFVDGVNLRALLRAGPLEPRQALAIARELCDALQYAHDEGVVHRDIKPENVLVDARGHVKVADFGLAKLVGAEAEGLLTRSDQVMGTPHYMAPEQLERPREVDHRADLFALGVVLYEMLTGSLPRGKFEPPSRRVQVDVQLDQIVLKALEHEPTRRYQQALEIKTDVEHVGRSEAPREPSPAPPRPEEARHGRRRGAWHGGPEALRGWRATVLLGLAWILLGVAWNLGPFAVGLGIVLAIAAFARLLAARVRAVPEWDAALQALPAGERLGRRVVLACGVLTALLAIGTGHLVHWERGVNGWHPRPAGTQGLFAAWNAAPWDLLGLAAIPLVATDFVRPGAVPRVTLLSDTSSVPLELPLFAPWLLILGGFVLLGATLGLTVHVGAPRELALHAWTVGGELASHGLGALLLLWLGSPVAALRREEVLQEVSSSFESYLVPEEALVRLRSALEEEGLEVEVEQRLRVDETRVGFEIVQATLLRASSPDPFERWSTSFAGPVRETPRIWVTVIRGLGGGGSRLQLGAGLYDPREPQLERAAATLRRLEQALTER